MKNKKALLVCKICNKNISKKDDYVRLTEYKEGSEYSVAFYHTQCFRDRFLKFQKIQKDAEGILGMAKPLLEKMQGRVEF